MTEMTVKPTAARRRAEQLQNENDALNATINQNLQRQQELEIENDALKTALVDMQQEVTAFMKAKEEELASANRLILSLMEDLALRIKGGK